MVATSVASANVRSDFQQIRLLLEEFRLADRSTASDENRLVWLDEVRDIGRRVTALTSVLVAEADQAGSAMRARHTRPEDWMARSGQETPREASGAVWTARALERRPAVRDAAAAGRISVGQAKAIGEALDALPTSLDCGQRAEAEQLILTQAQHAPAEKLRTMTERILHEVAPEQVDSPDERAAKLTQRDRRARNRRKLWRHSDPGAHPLRRPARPGNRTRSAGRRHAPIGGRAPAPGVQCGSHPRRARHRLPGPRHGTGCAARSASPATRDRPS